MPKPTRSPFLKCVSPAVAGLLVNPSSSILADGSMYFTQGANMLLKRTLVILLCSAIVGCWSIWHVATLPIILDGIAARIVPEKAIPRLTGYSEGIPILDISVHPQEILSVVNSLWSKRSSSQLSDYIGTRLQWHSFAVPLFDIRWIVARLYRWKGIYSWKHNAMISHFQESWGFPLIHTTHGMVNQIIPISVGYFKSFYISDHPSAFGCNDMVRLFESRFCSNPVSFRLASQKAKSTDANNCPMIPTKSRIRFPPTVDISRHVHDSGMGAELAIFMAI